MKILYVVPNINNGDGISRIIDIKANYLIENYGYEIVILTQNKGHDDLFFDFNKNIVFYDIQLSGTIFQFFNSFRNQLKSAITKIKPDRIIVCDNGLKAFLIPFIINPKIPLLLEIHSSLYVEESYSKDTLFHILISKLTCLYKQFGASQYNQVIVETYESSKEWKLKRVNVISNPLWFSTDIGSNLSQKNVIAVGRHVYEKGFDRLLEIWKKVIVKHPDWNLTIYGKSNPDFDLVALAKKLTIEKNITFHNPVKNIEEKYLEASIYLMTSRFEGFGMVLIEAMASGLPCIAYDCPCGPRAIIENNNNGFLIEDENENQFIQKLNNLIENENMRIDMGNKAKISVNKYQIESIMKQWNSLFKEEII